MQIVTYNKLQHRETLDSLFDKYEWSKWDEDTIPPNSFIAFQDNKFLAFSCFYCLDVKAAIMGFTIADPEISKDLRSEALDNLLNKVFEECNRLELKNISYYTDSLPMVKRMEKLGMTITDNGTAYILVKSFNNSDIEYLKE
jgi:hypothetical protein